MPTHHLAELNVAQTLAPLDSPTMAEFVANIERINDLADASPGFVWRYQGLSGESAMESRLFGEGHIVTMSVWTDVEHLHSYVYRTAHAQVMAKRKHWFKPSAQATQVLWWIPAAEIPTLVQGAKKLTELRDKGPTASAFTFKSAWPMPSEHNKA